MTAPLGVEQARGVLCDALGRDPGPLQAVESASHQVFLGAHVVLKVTDTAGGRGRLDREIALLAHLTTGLSAPWLADGRVDVGDRTIRYLCQNRLSGTSPGIGLPSADAAGVLGWARRAIGLLQQLHAWSPEAAARRVLGDGVDDGGFAGRVALERTIASVAETTVLSDRLVDGLSTVAARAPFEKRADVPVHADCHWGNWLVHQGKVVALLDFEWARWGDPVDDWFFLIRFSGPFRRVVLDAVLDATGLPADVLRAGCERREAAYLLSDLRDVVGPGPGTDQAVRRCLADLDELVSRQSWW